MYIREITKLWYLGMLFFIKFILAVLFQCFFVAQVFSQSSIIDGFLGGKSVVLISAAPGAEPLLDWDSLAVEVHPALVEAGGDPVAYYELENIVISPEKQAGFAASFNQRLIKNVVILTRKENAETVIHIMPFSQDENIVSAEPSWSATAKTLDELKEKIIAIGKNRKSHNLLVIDVPEFLSGSTAAQAKGPTAYLSRNPLNLEIFKLGVPLSGMAEASKYLTTFRYDLLGKSPEQVLAEQKMEKVELEKIFNAHYPYEIEFLSSSRTDEELIQNRVQFILMRIQGREGDLMKSMGLEVPGSIDKERIVVKYFIKFLVRDEYYIGPEWDADPSWKVALTNFIKNLKKPE